jgi:murein L,D-transpeptidase YafK
MKRFFPYIAIAIVVLGVIGIGAGTVIGGKLREVAERIMAREARGLDETRASLEAEGLAIPLGDPRIVVRKAERRLELRDGENLVRTFPVALGGNPTGHKERSGDERTPEGTYYLCTRVNPSQFHLFLGISYPAPEDAAGRADVSDSTCKAIGQAWQQREKPPWDSVLGGAIGIHGGGDRGDWTLGCIAVSNQAVEELWLLTQNGTPVVIEP